MSVLSQVLSEDRWNPSGCECSGSAAPPLPELNRDKAGRLEDSYLDSRREDDTRGQTKLAHQRGGGVDPSGNLPPPPFDELEVPAAARLARRRPTWSHKWGG